MAEALPRLVPPPADGLVRVGWPPDPFVFRGVPPLFRGPSGQGGGRFDAPADEYRALYFGTTAYDALVEVLAAFRPSPSFAAQVDAFVVEDGDPEFEPPGVQGRVPRDFFASRALAQARVHPLARFIDVEDPQTHGVLHERAPRVVAELGLPRVDRGSFLESRRQATRMLARALHALFAHEAVGLRYSSSLDAAAECWVLWDERPELLRARDVSPVDLQSTSVIRAATRLRLGVDSGR